MNKGIRKIFSEIHQKYEIVNHILTFGLDIYWRRKSARLATKKDGKLFLDICTGTGEMAWNIKKFGRNNCKVIALDFCYSMLERAKSKRNSMLFIAGDVANLPFPDEIFDIVTISFATRNLNFKKDNLIKCLIEIKRVLKKGGRFFNLETTQPEIKFGKMLFHAYVKIFVKPLGSFISGSEPAYKYLSWTIPKFYDAEELKKILKEAGFSRVFYKKFFPGVVALHIAEK